MKNRLSMALCILLAIFATGCVNVVSMTKVTPHNPNPTGERVFLPQPFLVGRTTTNGTMLTYDIEMLPDPSHEYAIDSYAFLSKLSLGVHRSVEGYFTGIDLNADSSTLASAAVTGAGQMAVAAYLAKTGHNSNDANTSNPSSGNPSSGNPSSGNPPSGGSPPPGSAPSNSNQSEGTIKVMYRIVEKHKHLELDPIPLDVKNYYYLNRPAAATPEPLLSNPQ